MAKDWFYQANDEEKGPFSGTELKQLAHKGEIVAETKIRKGSEGRWVVATQVQGLIPVPGSASPTDTISPAQLPPKEPIATKSPAVSRPKPITEPRPAPTDSSPTKSESVSNPFDPFAAFSGATEAHAETDSEATTSADPAEDIFGFSDSFSNPSALKKKIKAVKAAKPAESDSDEPAKSKSKRKGIPKSAIFMGAGGVLAIIFVVAGYFLIFKKDSGNSGSVAKSAIAVATNKEKTESSDKNNHTNTSPDGEKASTKTNDKSPAAVAENTVARIGTPVEVTSKKADAAPTIAFTNEADLYEAVAPSVAMIRGRMSGGSGFLLEGNIVVTNKHVIESDLIEKLKIHFPSAGKDEGPYDAELLYKDRDRDIALLRVITPIKPTRLVRNYKFRPGERVLAIGSPGSIADDNVSPNAPSTGNLSIKTEVDHKKYYQLDMPVNSGNSGGPVFDYKGNVVGVVTLKAINQESHGFCIPAEEVEDSIKKMKRVKESELAEMLSNHRVKAVYSVASESSKIYLAVSAVYIRVAAAHPEIKDLKDIDVPKDIKLLLKKVNQELHDDIQKFYDDVMQDKNAVSDNLRDELKEFWENFLVLKKSAEQPAGKLKTFQKNFQTAAEKFATLKKNLKEGLGVEFDH